MTDPLIALAADHAGFELKNSMKGALEEHGFPLLDLGPETADPVDYPDMAGKLAAALQDGRAEQGLLVCGTGIGIAIAANRYCWIRAAVCHDATAARLAREHNDAAPDRARGGARLSVDLSEDALCRGPARAACGQNVVRASSLSRPFFGGRTSVSQVALATVPEPFRATRRRGPDPLEAC